MICDINIQQVNDILSNIKAIKIIICNGNNFSIILEKPLLNVYSNYIIATTDKKTAVIIDNSNLKFKSCGVFTGVNHTFILMTIYLKSHTNHDRHYVNIHINKKYENVFKKYTDLFIINNIEDSLKLI